MLGETPLPKHIGRTPTSMDNERFQTIYAEHEGAIHAPIKMHFSKITMKNGDKRNRFCSYYSPRGLGTFNEIMVEDLSKHKMESEEIFIQKSQLKS